MTDSVSTKVLVYEPNVEERQPLRAALEAHHLQGLRVDELPRFLRFLENKIDLGGLFIGAARGEEDVLLDTLKTLKRERPELPVFVRLELESGISIPGLEDYCCCVYFKPGDRSFVNTVQRRIFSRSYPCELVRTVQDETRKVLGSVFPDLMVEVDTPFLSHDKLLFGEIVSFVRLEGGWCRGYMLFEAREEALWRLLQSGVIPGTEAGRNQDADFRRANSLLTEISNLSWGRLKSWFEKQDIADEPERFRSELPCIINNERRYLSFGSDDAKLCFTYVCLDPKMRVEPLVLQQRLIFHLKWRPDQREADAKIESLVNEGTLVFL
ncbi:MAG: hypothetical protein VX210_09390 [Myxococcota bacterium]|nr:hypothetical protein [Myxococcota bacterium]